MSGVFHVSEAVSLGFHGMGLLALAKERVRVRDLAESVGASEAHMSKVFQRLARAGLVVSSRGPSGGVELAEKPEEISLLRIYEAIEGPLRFEGCALGMERCPFGRCVFGGFPQGVNRDFERHMRETSLADLAVQGD